MLKYVLLGFLGSGAPWTGYELKTVIDQSIANFWHAHHSQIYATLHRMEAAGLVLSKIEAQEDRPDKRVYTITETGRQDLQAWMENPLTSPTVIKDILLVKIFFSGDRNQDDILAELHLQRSLHQQRLMKYQSETRAIIAEAAATHPENTRDAPFWEMTRRFGVEYERMYITWLDKVIDQLQTGELSFPSPA